MFNFVKALKYLLILKITSKTKELLLSYRSFKIAAGLLIIYSFIGTVFLECFYVSYDIWEHVPQIMAFKDNPFAPVDPYLRGNNVSHLLTPYHFLLGISARLLGVTPLEIFYIAGMINLLFFLYSVRVLAHEHFGDKKYSLLLMALLLVAWLYPPGSSGYYNFSLIPLTLGYPYRAVFPFILLTIARYNPEFGITKQLYYLFASALAFTVHPLSGLFILLVIFTKTVLEGKEWNSRRLFLLLFPFGAVIIAIFWPFYPILGFITSANKLNVFNLPDAYKFYYQTIWTVLILLIPSVIMVVARLKKKRINFVLVTIFLLTPPVAVNYFTLQNEPLARLIVYLVLMMHLLTFEWIKEKIETGKTAMVNYSVAALLILFIFQLPFSFQTISLFPEVLQGKPIGYYSNLRYYNEYQKLDKWASDGGVILAPLKVSVMISRTTHCNIVAYYYPNPSIPGTKEKSADVERYFSTSSKDEKRAIINKYKVQYLVIDERGFPPDSLGLQSTLLGVIDRYSVYRIETATSRRRVSQ